ncbi:hypothetical protein KC330_g32 [Hortaea werneckii]|nr:hypothetical protein KC330_g32 [Hortaea werneckii]
MIEDVSELLLVMPAIWKICHRSFVSTYHVATKQLLPHLHTCTGECSLPDLWTEELEEPNALGHGSDTLSLLNFFIFGQHHGVGTVTLSMEVCQDIKALFPPLFAREPSCCWSLNGLLATVADEVHDQDTPFDGPLLNTDDSSSDFPGCQLGQSRVERHTESSDDKLGDVLRGTDDGAANTEDSTGNLQRDLTSEEVCQETGSDGTQERTSGHGGRDTTLKVAVGVVEIIQASVLGGRVSMSARRPARTRPDCFRAKTSYDSSRLAVCGADDENHWRGRKAVVDPDPQGETAPRWRNSSVYPPTGVSTEATPSPATYSQTLKRKCSFSVLGLHGITASPVVEAPQVWRNIEYRLIRKLTEIPLLKEGGQ